MKKGLTVLTMVWMGLLILLTVFWVDLYTPFYPLSEIFTFALFVIGAILIVIWVLSIRTETSRNYTIQGIAIALIFCSACGFSLLPVEYCWKAKFYLYKFSYEARVAEVYQLSPQQLQSLDDGTKAEITYKNCSLDFGPPLRVAFFWSGFLNSWYGVIYDPSDTVQLEKTKDRRIFGSDLVAVKNIEGHWYFCWFT